MQIGSPKEHLDRHGVGMPSPDVIDLVYALAKPTGGAVRRQTLLQANVTPEEIRSLLRQGHLVKMFRGTYVVGGAKLDHVTFTHCCLVHTGSGSAVSHRSGMELRKVLRTRSGRLDVTTKRRIKAGFHRSLVRLDDGRFGLLQVHTEAPEIVMQTELVEEFPTLPFERTMVDLAGDEPRDTLERAWREAEYLALLDEAKLELELQHRRSGSGAVREMLQTHPPLTNPGDDIRSRREVAFLAVVRAAGLPMPEKNVYLRVGDADYWADALWRWLGLVVEIDGPQHDLPGRRDEDRIHDVEFAAVGLAVIRFSTRRLLAEPEWCADRLAKIYAHAEERAAARRGLSSAA